ncbi:hypothetical protein CNY89_09920 [Amaricoccus sp. HAR-UPW-R2A-40]|nr:hypothetical protein CNY89_09920 [Amaricoccus sp. HAR-UPW-R2A-40]
MTDSDPGWLTRAVAGREKIIVGFGALLQTYVGAFAEFPEPHKAFVIGLIGLAQLWLTADSPKPPPADPVHPDEFTSTPKE